MADLLAPLAAEGHRIVKFPSTQPPEERAAALASLAPAARTAMRTVFASMLETAGYSASDLDGHKLEFFLMPRDPAQDDHPLSDVIAMSEDWRVIVTPGPEGHTLYDFNGWPGDNELGGGAVVGPEGTKPVLIFTNADRILSPVKPEHADAVEAYDAVRTVLVSTSILEGDKSPDIVNISTAQAIARERGEVARLKHHIAKGEVDLGRWLELAEDTVARAVAATAGH